MTRSFQLEVAFYLYGTFDAADVAEVLTGANLGPEYRVDSHLAKILRTHPAEWRTAKLLPATVLPTQRQAFCDAPGFGRCAALAIRQASGVITMERQRKRR